MKTRTCPDCHNQMHLYANRCGHCTSFSDPPVDPPLSIVGLLIVVPLFPVVMYWIFQYIQWFFSLFF